MLANNLDKLFVGTSFNRWSRELTLSENGKKEKNNICSILFGAHLKV